MSKGCLTEEILSAHVDGDLDTDESARVRSHLDGCDPCRATAEELASLRGELAGLADVEPARDLWAEISMRHNRESARRPWLRWGIPAFAALAAGVLVVVWLPRTEPEPAADPKIARAYASVVAAEHTYVESIAALEEAVGDRVVATLDPKSRRAIEQGLAQIDATIALCRRELKAAPNDFGAHRTLLAAYQRKVDLLTELVDRSI